MGLVKRFDLFVADRAVGRLRLRQGDIAEVPELATQAQEFIDVAFGHESRGSDSHRDFARGQFARHLVGKPDWRLAHGSEPGPVQILVELAVLLERRDAGDFLAQAVGRNHRAELLVCGKQNLLVDQLVEKLSLDRWLLEQARIDLAAGFLQLLLPVLVESRAELLLGNFPVAYLRHERIGPRDEIGFDSEERKGNDDRAKYDLRNQSGSFCA